MVSTNNPWHFLREQLMQIDDVMSPSAPFEKSMRNTINDDQWNEFDIDVLLGEKNKNKIGSFISVNEFNHSIVVTNILNSDGLLYPFDIILSLNDMNFIGMTNEAARCIINAHQGKLVKLRIRRLQPSILETIELNLSKRGLMNSHKLGFMIDGGIGKNKDNDPGLFIVGIKPKGQAANNGRLRIGDRLMQIKNTHVTINLQCIELDAAIKLIQRMRKESTSITLVIAHQTQN
jgi:C-terminal processing protease CtpA/Prc